MAVQPHLTADMVWGISRQVPFGRNDNNEQTDFVVLIADGANSYVFR